MSIVSDSLPDSSSSSGDFVAWLEEELESRLSNGFLEDETGCEQEDGDDEDLIDLGRRKRLKIQEDKEEVLSLSMCDDGQRKDVLPTTGLCPHPGYFGGLCIICAKPIVEGEGSGIALGYIHRDLKVSQTEIYRVREACLKKLLYKKKLILILDLDHTLLNSTRLIDLHPEEEYLLRDIGTIQDDPNKSLFKLDSMHMLTKLRPYVRSFLSEVSSMYEMYIYTMAEHSYAMEVAKLLDPANVYFPSKVISQSDCTQRHQKGLDVILDAESTVLILDDTGQVWEKHKKNLIIMKRYHYFVESGKFDRVKEFLSVAKKDEWEKNGVLFSILNVLKRVHQLYFDLDLSTDLSARDVRPILWKARQEVLQGCRVVFSHLIPAGSRVNDQPIWKICEELGATCLNEVDSSVTHVISRHKWTEKAKWAAHNEKFLVNPSWLDDAFYLWRRMPEADYPVE